MVNDIYTKPPFFLLIKIFEYNNNNTITYV